MTNILQLTCPIDALPFDLTFLQEWSDYMATWEVGHLNSFWTDPTIACPLGHRWAVNFNVEFQRIA